MQNSFTNKKRIELHQFEVWQRVNDPKVVQGEASGGPSYAKEYTLNG